MSYIPSAVSGRRFGGIARLYGNEATARFALARVCVVGVGGVGSWAAEALARSGIGSITLIDADNVAESNVNRQLQALSDTFGKAKIDVSAERIAGINPACEVSLIEDFVEEDTVESLFSAGFDFVIDAIDAVRVKAAMAAFFVPHKQPFAVSGGAGGQKDAGRIQTADLSRVTHDPLLASLRYTLRKRYGFSRNTAQSMHIPCVYSTETALPPQNTDACETGSEPLQGLSCAGYGAGMIVTASFGLRSAQMCLEHLCSKD